MNAHVSFRDSALENIVGHDLPRVIVPEFVSTPIYSQWIPTLPKITILYVETGPPGWCSSRDISKRDTYSYS